jgi:Xaa-Pro aminopeptidase
MLLVYGNDKAKALPWVGDARAYVDVPFPETMIADILKEMGLGEAKLGFELGNDQRLGIPENYLLRLTEALPKTQIKDGSAVLTEMRLIKSPQEIDYMRRGQPRYRYGRYDLSKRFGKRPGNSAPY